MQVMIRNVFDGRPILGGSDLVSFARKGSGSSKRGSVLESSGAGKSGMKNHSGVLFLYSRMKRSFQPKWCVLANGNFRYLISTDVQLCYH